jgi:hypothetical protein
VQIIEVSVTGVRSAVITLQRSETPMRIVLFPMIHAGAPAFYQSVAARIRDCDLVIAEGITGISPVAWALTLAYRLPGRNRRLGLTVQDVDPAALGVPVINADMTAREFARGWRSVPAVHRLAVVFLIPLTALAIRLFGTRRFLARYARHWQVEDLPGRADELLHRKAPEATALILDRRDALLVDALVAVHEARKDEPIDVAVLYGAAHMRAVTREMFARFGYRPRAAEWLQIIDF